MLVSYQDGLVTIDWRLDSEDGGWDCSICPSDVAVFKVGNNVGHGGQRNVSALIVLPGCIAVVRAACRLAS